MNTLQSAFMENTPVILNITLLHQEDSKSPEKAYNSFTTNIELKEDEDIIHPITCPICEENLEIHALSLNRAKLHNQLVKPIFITPMILLYITTLITNMAIFSVGNQVRFTFDNLFRYLINPLIPAITVGGLLGGAFYLLSRQLGVLQDGGYSLKTSKNHRDLGAELNISNGKDTNTNSE